MRISSRSMAAAALGAALVVIGGKAPVWGAERFHAPKPPQMPAAPQFHMPAMPVYSMPTVPHPQPQPRQQPQQQHGHTPTAQPHVPGSGTSHNASSPTANGSSSALPAAAMVPFHVSYRGFYNHYHNSYRRRLYPTHNRNNNLLSAQMKHLINLKADLDALAQGQTTPTQSQKDLLQRDMMAIVEPSASKPETEPVTQLSSTLADMVSHKRKLPLDTERLVYDLDVVMNSPLATPSEVSFAIQHGQSLFRMPGAARSDLETITSRLKAVALR
jgi:hypothetical protein